MKLLSPADENLVGQVTNLPEHNARADWKPVLHPFSEELRLDRPRGMFDAWGVSFGREHSAERKNSRQGWLCR